MHNIQTVIRSPTNRNLVVEMTFGRWRCRHGNLWCINGTIDRTLHLRWRFDSMRSSLHWSSLEVFSFKNASHSDLLFFSPVCLGINAMLPAEATHRQNSSKSTSPPRFLQPTKFRTIVARNNSCVLSLHTPCSGGCHGLDGSACCMFACAPAYPSCQTKTEGLQPWARDGTWLDSTHTATVKPYD